MDFQDIKLVEEYGSWVRVQVAFYDFLFETGSKLCPGHLREQALEDMRNGKWADGEDIYEKTMTALEQQFDSPEKAWAAFIQDEFNQSQRD